MNAKFRQKELNKSIVINFLRSDSRFPSVLYLNDIEKGIQVLTEAGVSIIGEEELFNGK